MYLYTRIRAPDDLLLIINIFHLLHREIIEETQTYKFIYVQN